MITGLMQRDFWITRCHGLRGGVVPRRSAPKEISSAGKNVGVGDYSGVYGDKSMQCCGDDGENYVTTLSNGNPVSSLNVKNSSGSTVYGVCCRASDTYVTYGGGGATDFTCVTCGTAGSECCATDPKCDTNLHCDIYHPGTGGTTYCCPTTPTPQKWNAVLKMCVNTRACLPKCTTLWDQGCYDAAVCGGSGSNAFCCPVSYQSSGDCFSTSDSIMGAIPIN